MLESHLMDHVIVATAQQQLRLFESPDEYRRELARFMQIAQAKGAELVVFPPLNGIPAASPLVGGFRVGLLRRAGGNRRRASTWSRAQRALAGSTAGMFRANFSRPYRELLAAQPQMVEEAYDAIFRELAQSYSMSIVAGSAHLPASGGLVRHAATVYGPDGDQLGWHEKVVLSPSEASWVRPGEAWNAIETPVGRLGLMFGEEIGYPEIGSWLAAQGVSLLVVLGIASDETTMAEIRLGAIARAHENSCYVVTSFPVGTDHLADEENSGRQLVGRSGIYAPLAQTPRATGALVEMGATSTEGLLTAELDGSLLIDRAAMQAQERAHVLALLQPSVSLLSRIEESSLIPTGDDESGADGFEADEPEDGAWQGASRAG